MDFKKECNGNNSIQEKLIKLRFESPIKRDVKINFVEKDDISVLSKTLLCTNKKDYQTTEGNVNPQLSVKRFNKDQKMFSLMQSF